MRTFRVLSVMSALSFLAGCAALKNTPRQDYTWEIGKPCEQVSAGLRMTRVEVDGRYWIEGTNNTSGREFFECFAEGARRLPYKRWLEIHKGEYPDSRAGGTP
jgi:hypothetical protein